MCMYCEKQELVPCNDPHEVQIWYKDNCSYLSSYFYDRDERYLYDYDGKYEVKIQIKYCPMCGKEL